jgi:hypothetical protein
MQDGLVNHACVGVGKAHSHIHGIFWRGLSVRLKSAGLDRGRVRQEMFAIAL